MKRRRVLRLRIRKSEADYTIVIEVKDFHYGSTGVSVLIGFGAGDAHMNALMTFYEKNVKQPFAVIDVDGVAGAGYGNEKTSCRDLTVNWQNK